MKEKHLYVHLGHGQDSQPHIFSGFKLENDKTVRQVGTKKKNL